MKQGGERRDREHRLEKYLALKLGNLWLIKYMGERYLEDSQIFNAEVPHTEKIRKSPSSLLFK